MPGLTTRTPTDQLGVHDRLVGDDLADGCWPGCLSRVVCQMAARSAAEAGMAGPGPGQSSSHRPLACWQRSAMMPSAPSTVQRIPDCLARWGIALQAASMAPEPVNMPRSRYRA